MTNADLAPPKSPTYQADAIDSVVRPTVISPGKPSPRPATSQRELRLDLFRGLALWLIFIDHVSPDLLTWLTIRNYGFSDAAEIFIFISGYTAALVYGRATYESGFLIGTARVLRRVWQIYTAHLLLFLVLMAEISYVTVLTGSRFYVQEMGISQFLTDPGAATIQALLLRFRPLNMDVLPLYVVLMLSLPLVLQLARWQKDLPLVLAIGLYILTNRLDLHLSTYPNGFWSFNPYAWQLLFVFGAWCALGGGSRLAPILSFRPTLWIAVGYVLAAFLVTMTWYFPSLESFIPARVAQAIYPIDKTDLDVLRFLHFLALATIAVRLMPSGWVGLGSPWLKPLILCGQYSLQIFSLGVALAFAGYALLTETSAGWLLHVLVGIAGIVIMYGCARVFTWYKWALIGRGRATEPASVSVLTAQTP